MSTDQETLAQQARTRIVAAQETDTILTRAFDVAQGLAWPAQSLY